MQLPEYDNAPCFAASLYANSMLKHLGVDNDSLDILLRQAEERLLGLQNADGSWSWFEGMNGSYYITLSVCENLALLATTSAEMRIRLNKALDYLDKEELAYFASLQKQKHPSYIPTESTLHYLYLYTLLTDHPMSKEVRKMSDTYLKEFQKMSKDLSIYGKANGSNILRHNGLTKPAEKFLQSALEYSVYKPGMGRYFDTRKAQYSWRDYKIPTQLAAMRAILQSGNTSFDKLRINSLSTLNSKLSTFIPQMLIWLLRQKQTQTWDNPMNTVDVADFILRLSGGTRPAGTSNESFSLDGKDITANDTIAVEAVSQLTVKATPDTSTSAHIMGRSHCIIQRTDREHQVQFRRRIEHQLRDSLLSDRQKGIHPKSRRQGNHTSHRRGRPRHGLRADRLSAPSLFRAYRPAFRLPHNRRTGRLSEPS